MKKTLSILLAFILLFSSTIIPVSAFADTDISDYSKYVYDSNSDPIDYNKVAVFKDIDELKEYIQSLNLKLENKPELIDGLVCYITSGYGGYGSDQDYDKPLVISLGHGPTNTVDDGIYDQALAGPYSVKLYPIKSNYMSDCLYQVRVDNGDYTTEQINEYYKTINRAFDEMDLYDKSDYAKATSIVSWIGNNIEYNDNYVSESATGGLITKKITCMGFAQLVNYFCNIVGIESYTTISISKGHDWNVLKINGKYYYTDCSGFATNLMPAKNFGYTSEKTWIASTNDMFHIEMTDSEPYVKLVIDDYDRWNNSKALKPYKQFVCDFIDNLTISGTNDYFTYGSNDSYNYPAFSSPYAIGKTEIEKFNNSINNLISDDNCNLKYKNIDKKFTKTDKYPPGNYHYTPGYFTNRIAYYTDDDITTENARPIKDCILNGNTGDKVVKLTTTETQVDQFDNPTDKKVKFTENRVIETGSVIKNTKTSHNYYKRTIKNYTCDKDTVIEFVCKDCGTRFCLAKYCDNHQFKTYVDVTPNTCTSDGKIDVYDGNATDYAFESKSFKGVTLNKLNHNIKTEIVDNGTLERTYCDNTSNEIILTTDDIKNNLMDYLEADDYSGIDDLKWGKTQDRRFWEFHCDNQNGQTPTITMKLLAESIKDGSNTYGTANGEELYFTIKDDKTNEVKTYNFSYNDRTKVAALTNVNDKNDVLPAEAKIEGVTITLSVKANSVYKRYGYSYSYLNGRFYEIRTNGAFSDMFGKNCYIKFTYDNCNYETTKELDHFYQETDRTHSTCTEEGTVEYTCKHCGAKKYDTLPLAEHTPVAQNKKDSTCSEEGYTGDTVCSVCGKTLEKGTSIPKKDHTYKITTVSANCISQGYDEYTCIYCGYSYKTNYVEPNGKHVPEYGVNKKEATCTEKGYTGDTICKVCHKVIEQGSETNPKNHSYVLTTVSATCVSEGYDLYTCSNCGDSYKTNIVAPNNKHTVVVDKAVPATCTTDGYTSGTHCSLCGKVISTQKVIKATGHKPTTIAGVPATCSSTGLTEGSVCSVCKTVLVEQKVIPTLDHKWDNGTVTVNPTCTKEGKKVYHCVNCDETMVKTIGKTNHSFGNNLPNCSVCGAANPNYVAPTKPAEPTTKPSQPTTKPSTTPSTSNNNNTVAPTQPTQAPASPMPTTATTTVSKPKKTKIKKVKAAKKAVAVTWNKVSGVSGYEVQVATDKKFKKNKKTVTIKKQKTTSTTVKKLKAKKKYYVRVRTYKTVNGKKVYSAWSSVKNVKTK